MTLRRMDPAADQLEARQRSCPASGVRLAPWIRRGDVRGRQGLDRAYTPRTRAVYASCMSRVRTNIEIEDTYLRAVMDRYGLHTKTDAVDLALRHLAGQPMSREEALAMRGVRAIGKVPADTGPARVR